VDWISAGGIYLSSPSESYTASNFRSHNSVYALEDPIFRMHRLPTSQFPHTKLCLFSLKRSINRQAMQIPSRYHSEIPPDSAATIGISCKNFPRKSTKELACFMHLQLAVYYCIAHLPACMNVAKNRIKVRWKIARMKM
jgi:hypothetical protein